MTARLATAILLGSFLLGAPLRAAPIAAPIVAPIVAKVEAPEEDLPIPPLPPDHPPADVAAPVPNADLQAPPAPVSDGVAVRPTLNAGAPTLPGGDPVPGTLYRSEEEQKRQFIPNPGIQLVVPLQK